MEVDVEEDDHAMDVDDVPRKRPQSTAAWGVYKCVKRNVSPNPLVQDLKAGLVLPNARAARRSRP